jgi:hypothetical protein
LEFVWVLGFAIWNLRMGLPRFPFAILRALAHRNDWEGRALAVTQEAEGAQS